MKKQNKNNDIVIYKTKNNDIKLKVNLRKETLWLNLNQISELFNKDKSVISRHINNIYKSKELQRDSTVAFFATVQREVIIVNNLLNFIYSSLQKAENI